MRASLNSALLISLAALSSFYAAGQSDEARKRLIPPSPPFPPPRPPVVWVRPELKPLSLQSASIDIKVRGPLATTRMELAFHNPNGRVIEGELVFPLGEGQSVSGYELEVDGRMRKAVAVPKDQGREVFEEVVRRGVDPGLAELTKGNVFRTRLYPIPPNGIKKVAISFEQELADTGPGFRYVLPLGWKEEIANFQARVEAVKQEAIPLHDADNAEPLTFTKWNDSFTAELKKEKYTPSKPLAFTVPKVPNAAVIFMVPDRLEPAQGWFTARVEPAIPADVLAPAVQRAALFYDASGSAQQRDREKEFSFLKTWLKNSGIKTVDLVIFRNDSDPVKTVEMRDGDAAPLLELLKAAPLDGGTSLGAVDLATVPEAQLALLVTDGQSNFGPSAPKLSQPDGKPVPVFTVHAAQAADHPALERIARIGAGQSLNLLTTSEADALRALGGKVFRFLGVKVLSGEATETAPELPVPVTRGFSIAGRYKGKTEIELTFGYGTEVTVTQRLTLDPATVLEPERGAFVKRVWAQKRIAELLPEPKENEARITQLGKENGLVTPFTSLLVLERIEDYARHDIEPPEADLREAWVKLVGEMKKQRRAQEDADYIRELAKQWKEFRDWHAKRHPWLETVLAPAAKRETETLARLVGPSGAFKSLTDADLKLARSIAESAEALEKRWLKDGAEPATRTTWEKEAVEVMMQLDTLRQKRIAAAPETERVIEEPRAQTFGGADPFASGESTSPMRLRARAALSEAAPSPAAPPPRGAADPFAGGGEAAPNSTIVELELIRRGTRNGRKDGVAEESDTSSLQAGIEVAPWNPDAPYLKKLRAAPDAYAVYLEERKTNAASSAFFLDCADFFRDEKKDERIGLRVLSNLAEMEYESAPLVRILAYRLQQTGRFDLAIPLFEEVLTMRPEEPQSRRDLALALSRQAQPDVTRAVKLLWEVASRRWDDRFQGIGIIALHELNALLDGAPPAQRPDTKAFGIPDEFTGRPRTDLRVVLTWDADATDIDLWVTDPAGETVMYNRNRGTTGGHVSHDFTGGYGPEVFTIRRALPGTYVVRVNYYGNRQQKFSGATTVQVEFQTAFGTPVAKQQAVTRRLTDQKEIIEVGKFLFRPAAIP